MLPPKYKLARHVVPGGNRCVIALLPSLVALALLLIWVRSNSSRQPIQLSPSPAAAFEESTPLRDAETTTTTKAILDASSCAHEDTLPICVEAAKHKDMFLTLNSKKNRVINAPVLFFCPCWAEALEDLRRSYGDDKGKDTLAKTIALAPGWLPVGVPRAESERVWNTVMESLDRSGVHASVLIELLRTARLYRARENAQDHLANLWSTAKDEGALFVLAEQKDAAYFRRAVMETDELAVDMGSNLGIVTIMISRRFPNVKILAVEAVAVTWMFQQFNLWMNIPNFLSLRETKRIQSVLATVGSKDGEELTMQFRDDSLTSTRNWNPVSEAKRTLFDLKTVTTSFETLVRRYNPQGTRITWFKFDCESCEYYFIPAIPEKLWYSIRSFNGELHLHFMIDNHSPTGLPPIENVIETHKRLCPFVAEEDHANCPFNEAKIRRDYAAFVKIA